ncbi:hypothetical protein EZS27_036688, partial [termite gut metagenome]
MLFPEVLLLQQYSYLTHVTQEGTLSLMHGSKCVHTCFQCSHINFGFHGKMVYPFGKF